LKLAADQGSAEGQIKYAEYILRVEGVSNIEHRRALEHYLQLAVAQYDSRAQMRLGIALLCGLFGRFDFVESRRLFEFASKSEQGSIQFSRFLRDSLSLSDCEILNATDFFAMGSIFSFLRSSMDESIPLIRILNPYLCDLQQSTNQTFEAWQDITRLCIGYLLDLSQSDSIPTSTPFLRSLPTDLSSCNSISAMIPLIFKMYSVECSLYKNVNQFLCCFPIKIVGKFMRELGGIPSYVYLLQSSIEYWSHIQPLLSDMTVYRGIQQHGRMFAPLYESMIGEVIVFPGFTSTSIDRDLVILKFINGEDSLLFEISLHPGDVAAAIHDYSDHRDELEILIAASSGFMVDEVEWIEIDEVKIAQVRLSYCISWYDFDIDDPPAPVLV
jgi:hypothetical protein